MSDYVTAIRTSAGDKKIDYNALANKPNKFTTISSNGTSITPGIEDDTITLKSKSLSINLNSDGTIEVEIGGDASFEATHITIPANTTEALGLSSDQNTVDDALLLLKELALGAPYEASTSAPSDTRKLWIDTTATTGGMKYYNGSEWVHVPVAYT